jgi:hypothetical protein
VGRLWRILSSSGVVWWGIPTALLTTYFRVRRESGWSWAIVTTGGFWLELMVALVITGVLGGLAFEWTMRKTGFLPEPPASREDRDHTA